MKLLRFFLLSIGTVTGIRLVKFEDRERIRNIISDEFLKFTPSVGTDLYQ